MGVAVKENGAEAGQLPHQSRRPKKRSPGAQILAKIGNRLLERRGKRYYERLLGYEREEFLDDGTLVWARVPDVLHEVTADYVLLQLVVAGGDAIIVAQSGEQADLAFGVEP